MLTISIEPKTHPDCMPVDIPDPCETAHSFWYMLAIRYFLCLRRLNRTFTGIRVFQGTIIMETRLFKLNI